MILAMTGSFMSGQVVSSRLVELGAGAETDVGTLHALPPPAPVDMPGRGALGMSARIPDEAALLSPAGRTLRVGCGADGCGEPAAGAGIRPGDEILFIDGVSVSEVGPEVASLKLRHDRVATGQTIELQLRRGDRLFDATLVAAPIAREPAASPPAESP